MAEVQNRIVRKSGRTVKTLPLFDKWEAPTTDGRLVAGAGEVTARPVRHGMFGTGKSPLLPFAPLVKTEHRLLHRRYWAQVLCGFGQQHPLRASHRVHRIAFEIVRSGVSMST
jgi:hypothetical protein